MEISQFLKYLTMGRLPERNDDRPKMFLLQATTTSSTLQACFAEQKCQRLVREKIRTVT